MLKAEVENHPLASYHEIHHYQRGSAKQNRVRPEGPEKKSTRPSSTHPGLGDEIGRVLLTWADPLCSGRARSRPVNTITVAYQILALLCSVLKIFMRVTPVRGWVELAKLSTQAMQRWNLKGNLLGRVRVAT